MKIIKRSGVEVFFDSNKIVAAGGTAILTAVPEMFGAETLLMNRCKDKATFDKTVALINDFKSQPL